MIGTAGSLHKLKKIKEIVSFFPINYKEGDFKEAIEKEFGESPVDLILDPVGANYWERNLLLLKEKGILILLGLMGGRIAETDLSIILSRRLRIIGTVMRSRSLEEKIMAVRSFASEVLPYLRERRLIPVIDSVFPFDQLHRATQRMENNENVGKIILTF